MSYETLLDALPYTDAGYDDPGAKQTVTKLNLFIRFHKINDLNTKKIYNKKRLCHSSKKKFEDTSQLKTILKY